MRSRRSVLAACVAVSAAVAGCTTSLDGNGGGSGDGDDPNGTMASPTDTDVCSAADVPYPTDAATDPRSYPDRPDSLAPGTLEPFLESYEQAYLYNEMVASNPNKYGRTNEITVRIRSVAVDGGEAGFTATVSGRIQTDFIDPETPTETPETATDTPLPIGHRPVETSYTVTDRKLERNGVTLECW
jgi:hypothetical protein